jgi:thioredoxin 1
MLKPTVEKFADAADSVNVYFCNIDEDHEMAGAFGIRSIPTLVYMEDGEIKNRKSGVTSYAGIEEFVNV